VEQAVSLLREALAANVEAGRKGPDIAEVRFVLAQALDAREQPDPAQAQRLAEQALADYRAEAHPREDDIAEIEAWLAERR